MRIYICDFEDSFTYNIFSELSHLFDSNLITIVESKKKIIELLENLEASNDKCCVILGPGPGKPSDYSYITASVLKLLRKKNIYLVGVCLGHQLIWQAQGQKILKCKVPIHGQNKSYQISHSISKLLNISPDICVQHYNSLCVEWDEYKGNKFGELGWTTYSQNNELLIAVQPNALTYQFHPESIGTTCPKSFFNPLLDFLL